MNHKLNNLILSLFLSLVLGIGVPYAFLVLWFASCPSKDYGMFFFPLLSANCIGDFVGQLGFFLTAMPAVIAEVCMMTISSELYWRGIEVPVIDDLPPMWNFVMGRTFTVLLNVLVYWYGAYAIIKKLRSRPNTEEPS